MKSIRLIISSVVAAAALTATSGFALTYQQASAQALDVHGVNGGAAPQHPAVTAPACGNAHPALPGGAFVWASLPGNGFAGGVGYVMEITNEGRHACSLRGVPGAAVQGSTGRIR